MRIKSRADAAKRLVEEEVDFFVMEFKHLASVGDLLGFVVELEGHVLDHRSIDGDLTVPNGLLCFSL